ncbi:terminase small subunit [Halogranum tailed virus 1]|uniref:Uncharacterized protein n=1 Tax=Halogranum tailed virus 1 TaxID=1273749 RepID=R4TMD4_9CAUD|nr:terminase small subunit [Halogranum tailed virus 1]AGM11333.1 hypothetical protein HGTV1_3 [Halogranum tailed virus 1]
MPNKEKEDGKCNARVRRIPEDWDVDEAYCANIAGFRTDHKGNGRCYLHGGATPKGLNNAEKHGLYSNRQNYYKNRSDSERAWIDAVVESLLEDMPGGDDPSFAKLQMVRNIAIDMHKTKRANDYIDEVGVVHKDKTVGYTDDGRPIKEDQENAINIAYDRLNRTLTRQMKELGILDDPDSQNAEAKQNIADELAALREAREN